MLNLKSARLALFLGLSPVALLAAPAIAQAQISVGISVGFAPPALPVYEQPPLPGDGYVWTPGYWAWDDSYQDYYWVPGTWVEPPSPGYLWTPGYWSYDDGGAYVFNEGYWGQTVGFYGGVNYGFGYGGEGYEGGYWQGPVFFYNDTVNNVRDAHIGHVFSRPAHGRGPEGVSFNGGDGGVHARPTPEQMAAARGNRIPPTANQQRQSQVARSTPALRASVNHGAPAVAATARPGELQGPGVVRAARASAPYTPPPAGVARRPQANANQKPVPSSEPQPAAPRTPQAPPARADRPEPRSPEMGVMRREAPREEPAMQPPHPPQAAAPPRPSARPAPPEGRPESRSQPEPKAPDDKRNDRPPNG